MAFWWVVLLLLYLKLGKARSQITCSFCDMEIKYMNKMIMTYFRKRKACGLHKVLRCQKSLSITEDLKGVVLLLITSYLLHVLTHQTCSITKIYSPRVIIRCSGLLVPDSILSLLPFLGPVFQSVFDQSTRFLLRTTTETTLIRILSAAHASIRKTGVLWPMVSPRIVIIIVGRRSTRATASPVAMVSVSGIAWRSAVVWRWIAAVSGVSQTM